MSENTSMQQTAEHNQSLWRLTIAPAIWACHFMLSYATASVWCAKMGAGSPLTGVRIAIGIYTLAALAGIGLTGWIGYLRFRLGGGAAAHDADTPEDRHRFLGFSELLLSGLSAIAVLYAAVVAVIFRSCY